MTPEEISNFRTERYASLNLLRWEHFLSIGLPLEGKTIFEPGAGIGDQTEWLLEQGVAHIFVQDGRDENVAIICERFEDEPRVTILPPGNLEECLLEMPFHGLDFIFCYGVYYHLNETPDFQILRDLSTIGHTIALDYLEGNDTTTPYGYENNSTSITRFGCRPKRETLLKAMKDIFGYSYTPRNQLNWRDPVAHEVRLIAIGSHKPLKNDQLEEFWTDEVRLAQVD